MPKLERKQQKIFGGDIPEGSENTGISKFGSLAANDPGYTKDPETIQSLPAYGEGWLGATVRNNVAPLQDMNALQYLFSYQLAYLFQSGVPEWCAKQEYHKDSFCSHNGILYVAVGDSKDRVPATETNYWRPYALMSIGPTKSRPASPSIGYLYFDTDIPRWITWVGRSEENPAGWTTIEGSPGDIKDVYGCDLNTAVERNPGWKPFVEANGRVIAAAVPADTQRRSGATTGDESIELNISQMPAHSHTLRITTYGRTGSGQVGKIADSGDNPTKYADFTTESAGAGKKVCVMQPTLYAWRLIKI